MHMPDEKESFQALVCEAPIVIVEIGSSRCCACSAIAQKLEDHYREDAMVRVVGLSLETAADLCAELGIYSAPAVLVYVQGQLTVREAGVLSVENLFRRVARYRALLEEV